MLVVVDYPQMNQAMAYMFLKDQGISTEILSNKGFSEQHHGQFVVQFLRSCGWVILPK